MKHTAPARLRVNLVPAEVRVSRLRRRQLRRLFFTSATYLTVLVATCAITKVATAPADDSPTVELARLKQQTAEGADSLMRLQLQLRSLNSRLEARRTLAQQPDFSRLLTILGSCIDGDAAVRQFQLQSTGVDPMRPTLGDLPRALAASQPPSTPIIGADREPRHFTLSLRGVATSEAGISRFTARLRELQLFDSVDLKRTGRDPSSENAIAFEIALILSEPSADSSRARGEGGRK